MREFKFLRGIYKDERVFSTDETNGTLFALYGDGSPISLDTKNNELFQKTIVSLPSEEREIYTIRPSQFKVSAEKQNVSDYTITYELNKRVYDNLKDFPDKVKTAAENHLSKNITADIPKKPSLFFSDEDRKSTPVEFTFENKTTINKHLYFKVTGKMKIFTRTVANDKNVTAYKVVDNEVKYNDTKEGTFYMGKFQELVEPKIRYIAPDSLTGVNDKNYTDLEVASSYITEEGFMFVHNSVLTNNIKYSEQLNADLYKGIKDFLVEVNKNDAVDPNTNMLKEEYVAYLTDDCANLKSCFGGKTYEFSADSCIDKNSSINSALNCRFFKKNQDEDTLAYVFVGKCAAQIRESTTIVNNYENSYSDYFILDDRALRQLKKEDLSEKESIYVYTEKKDSYNYPSFGGVYKDTDDTAYYVTLSDEGTEDISSSNATKNDSVVAPKQDSFTFRQIENIYINATES